MFADAEHPAHKLRPACCWAQKGAKVALTQTRAYDRLNGHGAIDLATRNTPIIEALTVNAVRRIALLMAIEIMDPRKRWIQVVLDNLKYHHAGLVTESLARPGCRIKLGVREAHQMPLDRVASWRAIIPAYCPHRNLIARLWGVLPRNVRHNRSYGQFNDFCTAVRNCLRVEAAKNWHL